MEDFFNANNNINSSSSSNGQQQTSLQLSNSQYSSNSSNLSFSYQDNNVESSLFASNNLPPAAPDNHVDPYDFYTQQQLLQRIRIMEGASSTVHHGNVSHSNINNNMGVSHRSMMMSQHNQPALYQQSSMRSPVHLLQSSHNPHQHNHHHPAGMNKFSSSVAVQNHSNSSSNKHPLHSPLELFVGNLSYFCDESHLVELFSQYATVTNARIMKSNDKKRSLMYGFVTLSSRREVMEMCKMFRGHLYMGRNMRVEPCEGMNTNTTNRYEGLQIHVAISSFFPNHQIIRPTEVLLRRFFLNFGSVSDVQVNWYTVTPASNRQEGYAFVTFEDISAYEAVLMQPVQQTDGITLVCTESNTNSAIRRANKY